MPEHVIRASLPASPAQPTAYLTLKHAQAQFGLLPAALDAAQLARVHRIAAEQQRIEARVLATPQAARVIVSRASVDAALDTIRGRYANELEFVRALGTQGLNLPALREEIARELHVEAVLELISAAATPVSALEVEIFFHLHATRLARPERRRVRHLLITLNDGYAENTRQVARQRIERLRAECGADAARFATLATRHSECPSATGGGLIGEVPAGQLFPSLDTQVFSMQAGEISPVVESPMGLHLLLCEAILPAEQATLAALRDRIRTQMMDARRSRLQRDWLQALMTSD